MADTAAMLKRYSDAAVVWHRIFYTDSIRRLQNPDLLADLEIFLAEVRQICWGLVATENHVADLWDKVMPGVVVDPDAPVNETPPDKTNVDIVDFVLNGTAYLFATTGYQSGHLEDFIAATAKDLTWIHRCTIIDQSTKDRSGDYKFLVEAFKGAPWMVFMYVLSVTEFPTLLNEADLKSTLSNRKQDAGA